MANNTTARTILYEQRLFKKQLKYGILLVILEILPILLLYASLTSMNGGAITIHTTLLRLQNASIITPNQTEALVAYAHNASRGTSSYNAMSNVSMVIVNPYGTLSLRIGSELICILGSVAVALFFAFMLLFGYKQTENHLKDELNCDR